MKNPTSGLQQRFTAALLNGRPFPHQSSGLFRPSEASATIQTPNGPLILGSCKRRTWLRLKGVEKVEGDPLPHQIQRMNVGKEVENSIIETCKREGLYVANNVPFRVSMDGIPIAGELDAVLRTEPCGGEKYIMECCTPDTLVSTYSGETVPISRISKGTEVLSSKGLRDFSQTIQKRNVSENVFTFVHKADALSSSFTEKHPILTAEIKITRPWDGKKQGRRRYELIRTAWKKAKEVIKGDYLCIPKLRFGIEKTHIFYDEVVDDNGNFFTVVNGKVRYSNPHSSSRGIPIPYMITLTEEFFWILGLYLAEGSCSSNAVYFSLHKDEKALIERIKIFFKTTFGLEAKVDRLKSDGINVRISSVLLAKFFKAIIPGNSRDRTKKIKDLNFIPETMIKPLLLGAIAGDGHRSYGKAVAGTNVTQAIQSAVPEIGYLYFQIAAQLGLEPCFKKAKQHESALGPDDNYIYRVSWSKDKTKGNTGKLIDCKDFWAVKVKKVESKYYIGPVYNFGAEKTSTYTAGGIAVHNCKSMYGYYAQKSIFGKFIGNGRDVGAPKDSYIMQISLYLNHFSRLPQNDPSYLPFGAVFVCDRGDGHFGVFDVWLEEQVKIIGEDEMVPCHKIFYQSDAMGVPRTQLPYTVEDILAGYRVVQDALQGDEPPPRDFVREYNREQVEAMHSLGKVSDSAYKKWISSHGPRGKGKEKLGDWNCQKMYCPWSSYCWGDEE